MTQLKPRTDLSVRLADSEALARVVREGGREAVLYHKRMGVPVSIWRDGEVVEIPPEEIPDDGVFPASP